MKHMFNIFVCDLNLQSLTVLAINLSTYQNIIGYGSRIGMSLHVLFISLAVYCMSES